jgi:hypothetical protein
LVLQLIKKNTNTLVGTTSYAHIIGKIPYASVYYNGYMTEVHFVDAQQLSPTDFGEYNSTTGVWQPKAYTGSYGTNGFYLNFSDNSGVTAATLGADSSGNGNNWTPNGFVVSPVASADNDSLVDTPTPYGTDTGVGGEVRGNYGTYDVLTPIGSAAALAPILNGNLQFNGAGSNYAQRFGNFRVNSGKWYYEWTLVNVGFPSLQCGWHSSSSYPTFAGGGGQATGGSAVGYFTGPTIYLSTFSGGFAATTFAGTAWAATNVIMIAIDLDAGKFWGGRDGVWYQSGDPSNDLNPQDTWTPSLSLVFAPWFIGYGAATDCYANFGQRPFDHAAPTGFQALVTTNIPAGTVTTSGSFTGNTATDGPFVYLNGVPTAMTINGNAVTFGTDADKLANGFKVRSSSSSYNASGSNTYSVSTTGEVFKNEVAQPNP